MPFEMRDESNDVSKAFDLCKRLINGCLSNGLSLYQTEEVWRDILCTVDSRTIQNLLERQQIDEIHQYTEPIDWKKLENYRLLIDQSGHQIFPQLLEGALKTWTVGISV